MGRLLQGFSPVNVRFDREKICTGPQCKCEGPPGKKISTDQVVVFGSGKVAAFIFKSLLQSPLGRFFL